MSNVVAPPVSTSNVDGGAIGRRGPSGLWAVIAWLLLAACSDATSPAPKPRTGMTVVASPAVQDTIEAIPTEPLVIELRDSTGALSAGVGVRFVPVYGTYLPPDCCGIEATMAMRLPGTPRYTVEAITTTGPDGRASLEVGFGRNSGPAGIIVVVADLGLTDTVDFTVEPGHAVELDIAARDTAVMIGHVLAWPETNVWDRWHNPRPDPVTFSVEGALTLQSTGAGGGAFGTGRVIATSGAFKDTMDVSVVPAGMLAAYLPSSTAVVVVNLDGTARQTFPGVAITVTSGFGAPTWMADGQAVVVRHESASGSRLDRIGLGGMRTTLPIPDSLHPSWPSVSPDGEWVYFSAYEGPERYKLWRSRLDGSGLSRVSSPDTTLEWRGDVSRTGEKIVYVTSLSFFAIRDLTSGTATPLPLGGQVPHFSPIDDRIAYLTASPTGKIAVMDPDGSNVQPLTPTADYGEGLDWSPDGRWIVAQRGAGLEVIEVATGARVPLWWAENFKQPAWRPQ